MVGASVGISEKSQDLQTIESHTKEDFTTIVDSYEHSFLFFEEILAPKIEDNIPYEEMWDYLYEQGDYGKKWNDIEGADYDGVYMYYNEHFVYSWGRDGAGYEEYDPKSREWYYGAVSAKGEIYSCAPYLSYRNNYMLATISRLQSDGKTVIAYDLTLGSLQNFINNDSSFDHTTTMILSHNNVITSSSFTDYVGSDLLASEEELAATLKDAEDRYEKSKGTSDEPKREEAVRRIKSFISFYNSPTGTFARDMSGQEDSLQYSVPSSSFGYSYSCSNGRFTFIIVFSILNIMPTIAIWWVAVFFALIIFGLIWWQIHIQRANSKLLANKNQQLASSAIREKRANATKSRFLAQMSHEIRTPMNAIMGLTSLAKDELDNKEQVKDYLEQISGSSKLLLSILNDVLDMSAIESGKMKLDHSLFSAKEQIITIAGIFFRTASKKSITYETRLHDFFEEDLIGDGLRLNQIALNLLSNALKFTPAGGKVALEVGERYLDNGKLRLTIAVKDTGCGMSEEMVSRLFLPFEQESAKTAAKYGGSGLGLSISKNLVDLMGGTIRCESKLGKGTSFYVEVEEDFQKRNYPKAPLKNLEVILVKGDEIRVAALGQYLKLLKVPYKEATDEKEVSLLLSKMPATAKPILMLPYLNEGLISGLPFLEALKKDSPRAHYQSIIYGPGMSVSINNEKKPYDLSLNEPIFMSDLYESLIFLAENKRSQATSLAKEYDFSGKKILLAEDTPLNVVVATHILKNVGAEVVSVKNGKEAYELFVNSPEGTFDAILMDVNMPVMDGYESTDKIRASDKKDSKSVPIFALSADAFTSDVERSLSHLMNGHLSKPISIEALYKALDGAFNKK